MVQIEYGLRLLSNLYETIKRIVYQNKYGKHGK